MSASTVKRKKMKDLVYSTLLKLEKNGEDIIEYLFDLVKAFEDKQRSTSRIKSKSANHLHGKTMNNNGSNHKKQKIKKKVNRNDIYSVRGSKLKKAKRRSNSLQHLDINRVRQNHKKHKKLKKKVKKKKKVRYHTDDDEDEYIDHGIESMINNLDIPRNARPKMMEMDKSKKITLMKQWFVAPYSARHVRAKSDPSTPNKKVKRSPFPDTDNYKNNKTKNDKKKLRNFKLNEAKKRKSKSMAPIKRSKNNKTKKVKKRVFYANEQSMNEPKPNKHRKSVKFSDDNKNNYTKRKSKTNKNRLNRSKTTNKISTEQQCQTNLDLMPYPSYTEEYYF